MVYQVVKVINIPISVGAGWKIDHDATTEVFQPVGQRQLTLVDGLDKLREFREWNKGKGITYRLIQMIEEKNNV